MYIKEFIDREDHLKWFYLLAFFVAANAFFNFICSSYGLEYPYNTFLFNPNDLHGDLIKVALTYINKETLDYSTWPLLYKNYLIQQIYGNEKSLLTGDVITTFHLTPLSTNISIFNAYLIQLFGPNFVVTLFYSISFIAFYKTVKFFVENKKDVGIVLLVVLSSYPILFLLTRGHIYSLIVNIGTIFFVYGVLIKRSSLPIILLAIICNIRPNAIFLGFLFVIYGYKIGIRNLLTAAILSILLFLVNYLLAHYLYIHYTLENFFKGLNIYYDLYVMGNGGNQFNNSMMTLLKLPILLIYKLFHIDENSLFSILQIGNILICIFGVFCMLIILVFFHQKRINCFELIFFILSIYVLISSVYTTYYMAFYFIFLLLPFKLPQVKDSKLFLVLTFTSIVLLSPKNYVFFSNISLEVIINPIVIICSFLYLLYSIYNIRQVKK